MIIIMIFLHLIFNFNDLLMFILLFIILQFIYFKHQQSIIYHLYLTIYLIPYIYYMQVNYLLIHLIFLSQLNVLRITIHLLFKFLLAQIIISSRNMLFQLHLDYKQHQLLYLSLQQVLILSSLIFHSYQFKSIKIFLHQPLLMLIIHFHLMYQIHQLNLSVYLLNY